MPDVPGCDLLVEAAGSLVTINLAVRLAAPGGHVVFINILSEDVRLDVGMFSRMLRQEITLQGASNSFGAPFPGAQWMTTLEKLGQGSLREIS